MLPPPWRVRYQALSWHRDVEFPDEVYTVSVGDNPEYETGTLRLDYTSFVTPRSVYDYAVEPAN